MQFSKSSNFFDMLTEMLHCLAADQNLDVFSGTLDRF